MEQNILDFIEQHVSQVGNLERDTNLAYWEFATSGAKKHEVKYSEKSKELKNVFADRQNYIRVRTYDEERMSSDPVVARQIRVLRLKFTAHQMPADVIERLVEQEGQASRISTTFRVLLGGQKLACSEVLEVFKASKSVAERRAAWEATRAVGSEMGPVILRLVGVRNRAARDLGYRDFYDMSLKLQETDEKAVFGLIDELLAKTEKPFKSAKSEIDSEVTKKFKCRPSELRPWHYADPFFQEVPPGKEVDIDQFYKRKDLEKLTREFFVGIGLDITDIMKRSDLSARPVKDQHAFSIHIDRRTNDIRVSCNTRKNETWMSTMLQKFSRAAYDRYLGEKLPYVLREAAHPLLTEAVALFLGRLSRSPEFLREVVKADRAAVTRTTKDLDALSRTRMLLMARWVGVMSHFERALYQDPGCDLNRLWWDLVEKFQFVRRPDGRRNGFDWASQLHLATTPVHYHNYVLGELVASQLKAAILRETGKTNIVGNPGVGNFLKSRLFELGASVNFNEALRFSTGSPLSTRAFLEEYCS